MSRNPKRYKYNDYTQVVLNHLENNSHLVSKKCLYFCIRDYYAKTGERERLQTNKLLHLNFLMLFFYLIFRQRSP